MKLPILSTYLLATLCTVLGHSDKGAAGEEKLEWTQDDAEELQRKWGFDVRLFRFFLFFLSLIWFWFW